MVPQSGEVEHVPGVKGEGERSGVGETRVRGGGREGVDGDPGDLGVGGEEGEYGGGSEGVGCMGEEGFCAAALVGKGRGRETDRGGSRKRVGEGG